VHRGGFDGEASRRGQQGEAGQQPQPSGDRTVRVTYDPTADAAYIYLVDEIGAGGVAWTYLCDPREMDGMINLDFDHDGHLVGIEVMDARSKLPQSLLSTATRPPEVGS